MRVLHLLRVEQIRPVIMAALPRLSERPEKLTRLLQNLAIISLRVVVARVNTGDLQRIYHSVAHKIEQGELKSPLAIARAMKSITPSDDEFKTAFSQLELDPKGPRKRLVRYLLSHLEAAYGGQVFDFDSSDATVEHILPENAGSGWETFTAEDRSRNVRRLGDLTPLEYRINKAIGSASYERKYAAYQSSRYYMTKAIVQTGWNPSSVRARQLEMAEKAVEIWRIDDIDGDDDTDDRRR